MGDLGLGDRAGIDRDADLGAGATAADAVAARAGDRHRDLYGKAMDAYREVARKTGARGIPPERVVAKIEHALSARRPRTRYLVGADARGQAFAAGSSPTVLSIGWSPAPPASRRCPPPLAAFTHL